MPASRDARLTLNSPSMQLQRELRRVGSGNDTLPEEPAENPITRANHFTGQVFMKDGRLTSSQPVLAALLAYAAPATLVPSQPASVTFHLDAKTAPVHDALLALCTVAQARVLDPGAGTDAQAPLLPEAKQKIDADVLVPLLLQVIQKGRAGLGDDAVVAVDPQKLPLLEHRGLQLLSLPAYKQWAETGTLHVFDLLSLLRPTIATDSPELRNQVEAAFLNDDDTRARLGAASVLQQATRKEFEWKALLGSLFVSAGIGSAWELLAAPQLKKLLFGAGYSPAQHAFKLAGIDSVPSAVIEAADTVFVLLMLDAYRNMARTVSGARDAVAAAAEGQGRLGRLRAGLGDMLSKMQEKLPAAAVAGAISAVGGYANNVLQYVSTGSRSGDLAAQAMTTSLAVWSAAAGVPPDVKRSEQKMSAAVVEKMREGVLPLPAPGQDPKAYVENLTRRALAASPSESIGQRSMAFAWGVSMIPLALGDNGLRLASESFLRIFRSTVFNPIEALGMTALVLMSRLRLPGLLRSDDDRHAQVVQQILDRARPLLENRQPISDQELNDLLSPGWVRDPLRHVGSAVIDGLYGLFSGAAALAGRALGRPDQRLSAVTPYEAVRHHGRDASV